MGIMEDVKRRHLVHVVMNSNYKAQSSPGYNVTLYDMIHVHKAVECGGYTYNEFISLSVNSVLENQQR